MERWVAKVIAIVLTLTLPTFFTILPYFLAGFIERKGSRGERVLCLLMCYGGGIFFGTFLLHMGPEVRSILEKWLIEPYDIKYPLTDFIIGCGFFFVLYAEKIVMRINKRRVQKQERRLHENCIMYQRNNGGFVCAGCSAGKRCDGFGDSSVVCTNSNTNLSSRISIQVAQIEESDRSQVDNGEQLSITDISTMTSDDSSKATTSSSGDERYGDQKYGDQFGVVAHEDTLEKHHHHQQQQHQQQHDSEATHHNVRSLILIMALSLHHIFEGLTLGLQEKVSFVFTLLTAIMCHETIISFSLGLQFVKCKFLLKRHIITACCCCIIMPIGVTIGTILTEVGSRSETLEIANGILQAFASGTFIFVTFFEILQEEIDPHDTSIGKVTCVMAGFATMSILAAIPEEPSETSTLLNNVTDSLFNYTSTAFAMTTETTPLTVGG